MKKSKKYFIFALLFCNVWLSISACKSAGGTQSRSGKKIKRGKPIPCPIKDC